MICRSVIAQAADYHLTEFIANLVDRPLHAVKEHHRADAAEESVGSQTRINRPKRAALDAFLDE